MALTKEIEEDVEISKNQLMQSSLDENCKKSLLRLLNISKMATNGISMEQKIQKVTEAICGLVISQISFLDQVDKKIKNANREQCKTCKAMKVANGIEEQKKREEIIDAWKKANGIKDSPASDADVSKMSVIGTVKTVLAKPWAWLFSSVLVFSPYGVDIVNAILNFFNSK